MKFVITGGCGFIGTNFASKLLEQGNDVIIIDDFSRPGSLINKVFLENHFSSSLSIINLDISKSSSQLIEAIVGADCVFHLAAQVAVTTSVLDPLRDFEVNAFGTLNLLEIIRNHSPKTSILFSSTNKVYGEIKDTISEFPTKYVSLSHPMGVDESTQLSFHSPYGCSKGAADQYVLDYSNIYGLKTIVFRQSCIYGDRQYGTEDQGWASWFILKGLKNQPVTLYGSGKQVRDMLHVSDLFSAWMLAFNNIDSLSGNAYNIGGGINNSISLLDFIDNAYKIGIDIKFSTDERRPGDQDVFISNNSKFINATGWSPIIDCMTGLNSMKLHLEDIISKNEY